MLFMEEVETETFRFAVTGGAALRQKFLSNMSKRAAELLEAVLKVGPPHG